MRLSLEYLLPLALPTATSFSIYPYSTPIRQYNNRKIFAGKNSNLDEIPSQNCKNGIHPKSASSNVKNKSSSSSSSSAKSSSSSFWSRIGSPKTVMAPMVAQSDLPFRLLCRQHGVDMCFTQMIHAHNFVSSESFQNSYLDVYPYQKRIHMTESQWNNLEGSLIENDNNNNFNDKNNNDSDELLDIYSSSWTPYHEHISSTQLKGGKQEQYQQYQQHPLIVQLAGHDPDTMSKAAFTILERTNNISNNNTKDKNKYRYEGVVSGIDVNCGCPQAIARKGRYGAFLMEESPEDVARVVQRLRQDLPYNVGVSAKIRIPRGCTSSDDDENSDNDGNKELQRRIRMLIDSGADMITIHGRTIDENKTKTQHCNWDAIKLAVKTAREYSNIHNFPIIANGGIEFTSDVQKCLTYTNASAVMSSEALLENPGVFSQTNKFITSINTTTDLETDQIQMDDIQLTPRQMFDRQITYTKEYLDLCVSYPPLPGSLGKKGGSFNCVRSHMFKFLYRYLEECHELRSLLGQPTAITSIAQARTQIVHELESRYNTLTDEEWQLKSSQDAARSSWYRRHREAMRSGKMHTRMGWYSKGNGRADISQYGGSVSVEDKKKLMQERIQKLRDERLKRNHSNLLIS